MKRTKAQARATEKSVEPLCVGVQLTADILGISSRSVWSLVANGDLEAVRIRRRTLIPLSAIRRLVAERTVRA